MIRSSGAAGSSGGVAIGTPSTLRARPRSIAAIPRQAASVASRMPRPTISTASAAPVLTPTTSTMKYANPSGKASSR